MHSRSPLVHNYFMEQQGLAGTYVPLAIKPGTLEPALRALHPLGFSCCNLTIPHKLDAMAIVDEFDGVAKKIGAISCVVVREDGSLFGTNNDWRGFIGNVKQEQPDRRADAGHRGKTVDPGNGRFCSRPPLTAHKKPRAGRRARGWKLEECYRLSGFTIETLLQKRAWRKHPLPPLDK